MDDFNGIFDRVCATAAVAGESAKKFAGKVREKTGVYVDRAKLNLRLAELEAEMEERFIDIGRVAYGSTRGEAPDNERIKRDVERLDALSAEVSEVRAKLGKNDKNEEPKEDK